MAETPARRCSASPPPPAASSPWPTSSTWSPSWVHGGPVPGWEAGRGTPSAPPSTLPTWPTASSPAAPDSHARRGNHGSRRRRQTETLLGHVARRRLRLADRPLIATVAVYNVANAVVAGYDLLRNAEPRVFPDRRAKSAMMTTATGMGVQVAATNAERTTPDWPVRCTCAGRSAATAGWPSSASRQPWDTGGPAATGRAGAGEHSVAFMAASDTVATGERSPGARIATSSVECLTDQHTQNDSALDYRSPSPTTADSAVGRVLRCSCAGWRPSDGGRGGW